MTFGWCHFFKGSPCKVVGMGGGCTLDHPQGASPGLGKKILYTKVGTAYNFAIGLRGGHHVKTGNTVVRKNTILAIEPLKLYLLLNIDTQCSKQKF